VTTSTGTGGLTAAAQLLHDFNSESNEPAPPPDELATRLAKLVDGGHVTVLLARSEENRLAQRLHKAPGFRRPEGEGVINQSVAAAWVRRGLRRPSGAGSPQTSTPGAMRPPAELPLDFPTVQTLRRPSRCTARHCYCRVTAPSMGRPASSSAPR